MPLKKFISLETSDIFCALVIVFPRSGGGAGTFLMEHNPKSTQEVRGCFWNFRKVPWYFFYTFWGVGGPEGKFRKVPWYFFCTFFVVLVKFLQNFFKYSLNFLYFLFNIFFKILFNIFLQHFSSTLFFEISLTFFQNFFKISSKKRGVGGVEGKFRKVPW